MLLVRRHLWLAFSVTVVMAGCQTETDTAEQPVPQPGARSDATNEAPAPAAPPSRRDTQAPPATPDPDDDTVDRAQPADPPRNIIPTIYRGRWDSSAAACTRSSSEGRLNVTSGSLRFYEGTSRVLAVRNVGGGIEVDVEHTAEGTTERRTYRLSTSGDQLTVSVSGHTSTRVRCS